MVDEIRVVSKPRVHEIGARRNTDLFFEFCDNVSSEIILRLVVIVVIEAKGKWVGSLLVSVECVDEILSPDGFTLGVIVELAEAGEFLSGLLVYGIVNNDEAVL